MNKKLMFAALSAFSLALLSQNGTIGINIGNMDRSVDPKSDFYQFANGTWIKNNVIPASEASYGSFNEIADRNNINLRAILEEVAADKAAIHGTNRQKIGTLYSLVMDTLKLEKEGAKPLAADIALIKAVKTKDQLISLLATLHSQGIDAIFGFHVDPDLKNSTQTAEYFAQAGISLPDKSYYTDEKYKTIREEFKKHLKNLFEDLGYAAELSAKNAEIVFKIESDLASKSMGGVELRNIETQYNVYNKESFHAKYPNVNLDLYLKSAGILHPLHDFIVSQPLFFENVNLMLVNYSISDWQVYLNWKLIHTAAPYL